MTVNYTPLLGLAQPVTGTESGTWGDTINASLTALLETAIAGTKTADVTSGNWTLTDIDGADDTARAAVLIPTGTNGATTRSILAPNQSKIYVIINQATGSVVIKGVTGPTTGVTIASGKTTMVAWNGSDFVELTPNTIAGILPVVNGGTGTSTPALVAGTNISITGTWPNQTITASGGGSGSVTSVAMTVPSFLSVSGSPITSSGTLAVSLSGTALPVANGGTGVTSSTGSGSVVLSSNPTFTGYTETVYTLGTSGSLALNPANGTVQSCAAAGTVTFTDSLSSGQSISLLLTNGSTYTINWPTITWVTSAGNVAPTLSASNTLVFWKISTTLYGALVGKSA